MNARTLQHIVHNVNTKLQPKDIFEHIIKLHQQYGEQYQLIKVDGNTSLIPILQQGKCKHVGEYDTIPIPYHIRRIDMPLTSQTLIWNVTEGFFATSQDDWHIVDYLSGEIFKKLEDIPITFIERDNSALCINSFRIEVHKKPTSMCLQFVLRLRVGIGISNRLREKVLSKCKNHCPKYMKCMLVPQECSLKWLMKNV